MSITDDRGNKLSQSQVSKKEQSRRKRERRITKGQYMNPAFCNICGYRIRSLNHESGTHHQQKEYVE